jgi:ornithine decarboxylase
MQTLKDHGAGFDCASRMEITAALATGVRPDKIIFANPVKPNADIVFARSVGVKAMTCDNICEIEKIHSVFPGAELILRLLADDSASVMRFGSKYGASPAQTGPILDRIQELGMTLVGISFHIGSGCRNPQLFESAIELCRTTADQATAKGLPRFTLVDIGGGFPGDATPFKDNEEPAFEKFAAVIAGALDCHFPEVEFPGIRFVSEPGRYFATASGCLFAMVQGKRQETGDDGETTYKYYLNDGVYGSFNSIMYDYQKPVARTMEEAFAPPLVEVEVEHSSHSFLGAPSHTRIGLKAGMHASSTQRRVLTFRSTIFGPTCDSLDTLVEDVHIRELHYGEWLCFDNMGAYTTAAASTFNGVPLPHKAFIHSPKDLQAD